MALSLRIGGAVACVAGLVLVGLAISATRGGDPEPTRPTVTWGVGDGASGCAFDEAEQVVIATLAVDGVGQVTVTITAHADENTSQPVGSTTRELTADGPQTVRLSVPVTRAPHIDEDGVAACSLSTSY